MESSTYTINSKNLDVRAFSNKRNARQYGNGNHVFDTVEDLIDSRIREDQMRAVYLSVTGYETRVKDREYLCELLFNALVAAKIPHTDSEMDFLIQTNTENKENVVTEHSEVSINSEVATEAVVENTEKSKHQRKRLDVTSDDPVNAFGIIPGSNRGKALSALWQRKGQSVPISTIIKTIYDSDDVKKYLGAASLVVKGLILSAQKEGVKFSVTKSGKGANVEYTIDTK